MANTDIPASRAHPLQLKHVFGKKFPADHAKKVKQEYAKPRELQNIVTAHNPTTANAEYIRLMNAAAASGEADVIKAVPSLNEITQKFAAISEAAYNGQVIAQREAIEKCRPILESMLQEMETKAAAQIEKERTFAESIGVPFEASSGAVSLLALSLNMRKKTLEREQGHAPSLRQVFDGLVDFDS